MKESCTQIVQDRVRALEGRGMQHFSELKVWQRAHALALEIYSVTDDFPREEVFGLTAQLRKSALSIGSNIAEGRARGTDRDFARFLRTALGSAAELESQLLLAKSLEILGGEGFRGLQARVKEVERMLSGLIGSVSRGSARGA